MEKDINYYIMQFKNLHTRKMLLRRNYEEINKMVRNGGYMFDGSEGTIDDEGALDKIYESTAPNAARKFVSVMMGLMWPSAKKSIKFRLLEFIRDTTEHKEFSEYVTKKMASLMDSNRSGFPQALEEFLFDFGTFGTAGIFISEDEDNVVKYKAWSVKNISIDEGEDAIVDTVYYDIMWTAKRIVDTYGIENVSDKVKDCYEDKDQLYTKFQIVQAIEPVKRKRDDGTIYTEWESTHFEVSAHNILKKGKFNEFPVPIARFYKDTDNVYGKSPTTISLPLIYEINRKVRHREMIEEQEIEPALGYDVNAFGGDHLDTTPGAINAFDVTQSSGNPVFRIIPPINVNITDEGIERMENKIAEAFSLDRLLDFNSGQPLTATEASIKNTIRGQSNNSVFSRLTAEGFDLWISRTFNIALKAGEFGHQKDSEAYNIAVRENDERVAAGLPEKEIRVIPDEVAAAMESGKDFYEIVYNTPANALRDSESLNSLVQGVGQVAQLGEFLPGVTDILDPIKIARQVLRFNSVDSDVLRSNEEIAEIQAQKQQQQQREQEQINQSNELTLQNQEAQVGAGQT